MHPRLDLAITLFGINSPCRLEVSTNLRGLDRFVPTLYVLADSLTVWIIHFPIARVRGSRCSIHHFQICCSSNHPAMATTERIEIKTTPELPIVNVKPIQSKRVLFLFPVCYNKARLVSLWRRYAARTALSAVLLACILLTLADIFARVSSVSQRMLRRAAVNGHGPFFVLLQQTQAEST